MKTKTKNRIINIITFVIHSIISAFLIFISYFSMSYGARADRPVENYEFYALFILVGIISLIANFFVLWSKFYSYLTLILIVLFAMILWILVEKSPDVLAFLIIYTIIFGPLTFYKYKLNHKN